MASSLRRAFKVHLQRQVVCGACKLTDAAALQVGQDILDAAAQVVPSEAELRQQLGACARVSLIFCPPCSWSPQHRVTLWGSGYTAAEVQCMLHCWHLLGAVQEGDVVLWAASCTPQLKPSQLLVPGAHSS
jgi:hypothetical protein